MPIAFCIRSVRTQHDGDSVMTASTDGRLNLPWTRSNSKILLQLAPRADTMWLRLCGPLQPHWNHHKLTVWIFCRKFIGEIPCVSEMFRVDENKQRERGLPRSVLTCISLLHFCIFFFSFDSKNRERRCGLLLIVNAFEALWARKLKSNQLISKKCCNLQHWTAFRIQFTFLPHYRSIQ